MYPSGVSLYPQYDFGLTFARATRTLYPPSSNASRACASGLRSKTRRPRFARAGGMRCSCRAVARLRCRPTASSASARFLRSLRPQLHGTDGHPGRRAPTCTRGPRHHRCRLNRLRQDCCLCVADPAEAMGRPEGTVRVCDCANEGAGVPDYGAVRCSG